MHRLVSRAVVVLPLFSLAGCCTTSRSASVPSHVLDVRAEIDGSDELVITPAGLEWRHKSWRFPAEVTVNGRRWDPQSGALSLADAGLSLTAADFRDPSVRVLERSGRDTVAVEPAPGRVTIYFDDNPGSSAPYHVRVEFLPAIRH